MITGNVILIYYTIEWIYQNKIDKHQTKKQMFKDFFRFISKIDFPPSKYNFSNKVKSDFEFQKRCGNFSRSKDEILMGLSVKKKLISQPKSTNTSNISSINLRFPTDSSQDVLNSARDSKLMIFYLHSLR
jgi:hypothetical protein